MRERALLNAYLDGGPQVLRPRGGLPSTDRCSSATPRPSALLSDADQNHIWEAPGQASGSARPRPFSPLELPTGGCSCSAADRVRHDGVVLGAVVEAYEPQTLAASPRQSPRACGARAAAGWSAPATGGPNLCHAGGRRRGEGGGVLAVGEPGVGKLAVLRAIFVDEPCHRDRVQPGDGRRRAGVADGPPDPPRRPHRSRRAPPPPPPRRRSGAGRVRHPRHGGRGRPAWPPRPTQDAEPVRPPGRPLRGAPARGAARSGTGSTTCPSCSTPSPHGRRRRRRSAVAPRDRPRPGRPDLAGQRARPCCRRPPGAAHQDGRRRRAWPTFPTSVAVAPRRQPAR